MEDITQRRKQFFVDMGLESDIKAQVEQSTLDEEKEIAKLMENAPILERERQVLQLYYGIGCTEASYQEIADALHLTPERVRQIKEKALRRIRNAQRNNTLSQPQEASPHVDYLVPSPIVDKEVVRQWEETVAKVRKKREEQRQRFMQGDMSVLEEGLSRLPERGRMILKMYYGIGTEKMTMEQIADSLGISTWDVRFSRSGAWVDLELFYQELLDLYAERNK